MIELLVTWFDGLKGIGEGIDEKGQEVFFKADQIYKPGEFLNTKRGEIVVITKRGEK